MKLIPFFRFGGSHGGTEDDDLIDSLPDELVEPVNDEEEETAEEEPEEVAEEKKEEPTEEKSFDNDSDLLRAFTSTEEEFTETSGLISELEDVSAADLLEELRALAPAFGVRVATGDEGSV